MLSRACALAGRASSAPGSMPLAYLHILSVCPSRLLPAAPHPPTRTRFEHTMPFPPTHHACPRRSVQCCPALPRALFPAPCLPLHLSLRPPWAFVNPQPPPNPPEQRPVSSLLRCCSHLLVAVFSARSTVLIIIYCSRGSCNHLQPAGAFPCPRCLRLASQIPASCSPPSVARF